MNQLSVVSVAAEHGYHFKLAGGHRLSVIETPRDIGVVSAALVGGLSRIPDRHPSPARLARLLFNEVFRELHCADLSVDGFYGAE